MWSAIPYTLVPVEEKIWSTAQTRFHRRRRKHLEPKKRQGFKKLPGPFPRTEEPERAKITSTKILNLSSTKLTQGETEILLLGLSFCPTPKKDITNFEKDLFFFTRKIRLKYHWAVAEERGEVPQTPEPPSLVKMPSKFTPRRGTHVELENVLQPIERLKIKNTKKKDNIDGRRMDLISLKSKADLNQIILKPADKGDMIVIQDPMDYRDMCLKHLHDNNYFVNLGPVDPSKNVRDKLIAFANNKRNLKYEKSFESLTIK